MSKTISQEEYDGFVEKVKAGKAVYLNGRRALTLEELHFAIDAGPEPTPDYVPPGVPMILGLPEQTLALSNQLAEAQSEKEHLQKQLSGVQSALMDVERGRDEFAHENEMLKTEVDTLTHQMQDLALERDGLRALLEAKAATAPEPAPIAADAPAQEIPAEAPPAEATPDVPGSKPAKTAGK